MGINKFKRYGRICRVVRVYLGAAAFCAVFGLVYAQFSHGVSSAYMNLMFLYPLLGGALVFFLLRRFYPGAEAADHYRSVCGCYHCGIATLTVGSTLQGVFEIAGTASPYSIVFIICGWGLCTAGVFLFLLHLKP